MAKVDDHSDISYKGQHAVQHAISIDKRMFQRREHMDRDEGNYRPIDYLVQRQQDVMSGIGHEAERREINAIAIGDKVCVSC